MKTNTTLRIRLASILFSLILIHLTPHVLLAQTSEVTTTITTSRNANISLGRDCWFTMCQNYDAGGTNGKVDEIMATSPKATTIHISFGPHGSSYGVPIQPNQVDIFKVPLAWEMNTSGIIENKGMRVWSNDADICVYLLSFNPYTSEGMYVLPTVGWGTNYTVAAYAGLYELAFDYPSEYAIVTNQNNTTIVSTPSCDIRTTGQPNSILHPKLKPFSQTINQGQCVQYVSILAQNCSDYDFTGTTLASSMPFGVVGASQCPNIPCDYPYCDFVTEMNQPRRLWDEQYLTMPTEARGQNNGDTFLVIGSQNGQTVYIDDPRQGPGIVFCQINNNQPYWFEAVQNPERFWSDAPFELVQYENSSTWDNSSIGDAAMTTMPGISQYTSRVVFQTPTPTGLPYDFTNYVNVMCPAGVGATTTLDGKLLASYKGTSSVKFFGNQYEGYLVSSIDPGTHILQCDTANPANVVGAYSYGYGSSDSYMWPASMGIKTFNTQDSFPPVATVSGSCFCSHVKVSDYLHAFDTHISTMNLDSLTNMYFTPDLNYNAGTLMDSTYYDLCVFDSSKPAYAQVTVYDYGGNATTITSSYIQTPPPLSAPTSISLGFFDTVGTLADTVWLKDTSNVRYNLTHIGLKYGNQGLSLLPPIPTGSIPAGDSVPVIVSFAGPPQQNEYDLLVFGGQCLNQQIQLGATGGSDAFTVSGYTFPCTRIGDTAFTDSNCVLLSCQNCVRIVVSKITINDQLDFAFVGNLPYQLNPGFGSEVKVPFRFTPHDTASSITSLVSFEDESTGIQEIGILRGCGIAANSAVAESPSNSDPLSDWLSGKNPSDILLLPAHPNPVLTTTSDVVITIGLRRSGAATLKLFDLSGKEVSTLLDAQEQTPGTSDIHFDASKLPAGTYFYRLEALGATLTGNLVAMK